jgi:hypothetical protein
VEPAELAEPLATEEQAEPVEQAEQAVEKDPEI